MSAALEMSATAKSQKTTSEKDLNESLNVLEGKRREFARLSPTKKAALIRGVMDGLDQVANRWVSDGCRAKHIPEDSVLSGEEWLAGPVPTMRNLRLLAEALDDISRYGKPRLDPGQLRRRGDGRVEVKVFPTDGIADSKQESFDFVLPGYRDGGIYTLVVKVTDVLGNTVTARADLR